ncbi:MAG: periplasmic heavy metal sensor [Armatimonadota bacterium]
MRMRAGVWVVIAIALVVGAYAVTKYSARDTHRHQAMLQSGTLAAKLQLTEGQRDAIEEINEEFQRRREGLRDEHRKQRRELMTLLRESPPDRERIDAKLAEIGEVQAEMQRLAGNHILDVTDQLDDRQRERLFELIGEAMCPGGMMGGGRDC